jgi:DNA-directed RNA polymerase subunit RPC12/RpoP
MGKEDIKRLCRVACGSCGFKLLFWSKDEAIVKCPKGGSEDEVERGEALNLWTNRTLEVA